MGKPDGLVKRRYFQREEERQSYARHCLMLKICEELEDEKQIIKQVWETYNKFKADVLDNAIPLNEVYHLSVLQRAKEKGKKVYPPSYPRLGALLGTRARDYIERVTQLLPEGLLPVCKGADGLPLMWPLEWFHNALCLFTGGGLPDEKGEHGFGFWTEAYGYRTPWVSDATPEEPIAGIDNICLSNLGIRVSPQTQPEDIEKQVQPLLRPEIDRIWQEIQDKIILPLREQREFQDLGKQIRIGTKFEQEIHWLCLRLCYGYKGKRIRKVSPQSTFYKVKVGEDYKMKHYKIRDINHSIRDMIKLVGLDPQQILAPGKQD